MDAAAGLNYLHTRSPAVVHGDVRTVLHLLHNVQISRDGTACICNFDFGPLHRHDMGMDTSFYIAPATRRWASPETASTGMRSIEADVYSFGFFMWELYSGHPPFPRLPGPELAVTLRHGVRPDRPPSLENDELWDLIWACWSRGPRRRPTMAQVHDRLRAIGEARTVTPGPLDTPSPPGPSGTVSTA
ncbi:kinase-like protein [Exidia glandulosa HHB12029]|uniref:Kinase-like protein n=1 Tax=Exidia glandulosa HHB12029 TaxID=1314781 RepID=A0A165FVI8_EXIGL|nr:kinase-like protein [Exidia glandulosa HHB12029]